jgi:predicted nucleic-acid-binding protein
MVAIDTNVAVRLLTNDDHAQTQRVVALFKSNEIFISKTVVLETEWILRAVYQLDRKSVNNSLRGLLSLERVVIEDEEALFAALDVHEKGMDFADALHLASSRRAGSFATFDARLRKSAINLMVEPQTILP